MRELACPAGRLSGIIAVLPLPASQSCSLLFSSWLQSKPVLANSSQQPHRQTTAHAAWPWLLPSSLPMSRPHILGWAWLPRNGYDSAESESSNAMSRTSLGRAALSIVALSEWCCAGCTPI